MVGLSEDVIHLALGPCFTEGDLSLSLASVAKDLGFDGRELTDMLEQGLDVGIDEASSPLCMLMRSLKKY